MKPVLIFNSHVFIGFRLKTPNWLQSAYFKQRLVQLSNIRCIFFPHHGVVWRTPYSGELSTKNFCSVKDDRTANTLNAQVQQCLRDAAHYAEENEHHSKIVIHIFRQAIQSISPRTASDPATVIYFF